MGINGAEIKQILASESMDFKRLYEKHQNFEKRLDQLQTRAYLTCDEEMEMVEIKKRKLSLKDKMQQFVAKFRENRA